MPAGEKKTVQKGRRGGIGRGQKPESKPEGAEVGCPEITGPPAD
jgi:hypothetical protein